MSLIISTIAGGVLGYYFLDGWLSGWLWLGVILSALLGFLFDVVVVSRLAGDAHMKPSTCPSCKVELRKPLAKYPRR